MFLSLLPPCSVESSKKIYGQLAHTHTHTNSRVYSRANELMQMIIQVDNFCSYFSSIYFSPHRMSASITGGQVNKKPICYFLANQYCCIVQQYHI